MRIDRLLSGALLLGFALTASAAPSTQTQPATGAIARLFALSARDGKARDLEAGYRRHLDWHVAAGDPWAWYLWQIVDGERAGTFVDGTFEHAWSDFDRPVDPPGDAADNARNVDPHATRPWSGSWRARPDLGAAAEPESPAARVQVVAELRLAPGSDPAGVVRALGRVDDRPHVWFERVSGGPAPELMLWLPAASLGEAGARAERLAAALARADARTTVRETRVELWRFRPDLGICRSARTGCHAVVPGAKR
jgi:hypothetical protein